MTPYLCYIPCSNLKEAKRISHKLIGDKLIFCANIHNDVTSIYEWKGKIQQGKEVIIIAKTKKSSLKKIEKIINETHSYDTPCILSLKIENINKKYLKYLASL